MCGAVTRAFIIIHSFSLSPRRARRFNLFLHMLYILIDFQKNIKRAYLLRLLYFLCGRCAIASLMEAKFSFNLICFSARCMMVSWLVIIIIVGTLYHLLYSG